MASNLESFSEQLSRIRTRLDDAVSVADHEEVQTIAETLMASLEDLAENLSSTSSALIQLPISLSDLAEEPEMCQYFTCENWALEGQFFCRVHN